MVCALLISSSNLFQNCLGLFSRFHPCGLAPISIFSKFMGFLFFILGATMSFELYGASDDPRLQNLRGNCTTVYYASKLLLKSKMTHWTFYHRQIQHLICCEEVSLGRTLLRANILSVAPPLTPQATPLPLLQLRAFTNFQHSKSNPDN